ncbi:TIGR03885 family FMN-dependent LLM class oxidoreductase [Devosia albogilva]|uniref:TIGR03885 family FMN-dependent LLM class oxidoreductase n=1 Tax=Devosia albogilva TaxID=429726 RepID=A0ABW5QNN6_9HYPH
MAIIGYHASHEQIDPASLLKAVVQAEQAGFDAAMCSDHFAPWSERQGQSGFAWSWLGAALQATKLPFGVVNAPGQRYHPAIIAQAGATLAQMFPGRFWMALGSGEAANEHITGDRWPEKATRNARLGECVDVMRRLFAGETVTHQGLVTVDRARLWTLPTAAPKLIGAAVSPETAAWVGGWADGLITINQPHDKLREMIDAFHAGGGEGKPVYLQIHLSYAPDADAALEIAFDQWRSNVFSAPVCWDLELPQHFDEASRFVRREDLHDSVLISNEPARFVDLLGEFLELGFAGLYLHHVGQEQQEFIDVFGAQVLPKLREGK